MAMAVALALAVVECVSVFVAAAVAVAECVSVCALSSSNGPVIISNKIVCVDTVLQASTRTESFTCLSVEIDVAARSSRGGTACDLMDCFRKLSAPEVRNA